MKSERYRSPFSIFFHSSINLIQAEVEASLKSSLADKTVENETLSTKLAEEKKINEDLSLATTKLQKLLEGAYRSLQAEKEKNKKVSQVRAQHSQDLIDVTNLGSFNDKH